MPHGQTKSTSSPPVRSSLLFSLSFRPLSPSSLSLPPLASSSQAPSSPPPPSPSASSAEINDMLDRRSKVSFWLLLFVSLLQLTLQQIEPLSSPTERAALLQLRGSLGLRSREWPTKPDPCLIWLGITCRNGTVVGINISGFKRTRIGRLDPQFAVDALANFTSLESFNASNFMLPGPIPDWFGLRLRFLRVLDLRSCSIIAAIPSKLQYLNLSSNGLTNLPSQFVFFGGGSGRQGRRR